MNLKNVVLGGAMLALAACGGPESADEPTSRYLGSYSLGFNEAGELVVEDVTDTDGLVNEQIGESGRGAFGIKSKSQAFPSITSAGACTGDEFSFTMRLTNTTPTTVTEVAAVLRLLDVDGNAAVNEQDYAAFDANDGLLFTNPTNGAPRDLAPTVGPPSSGADGDGFGGGTTPQYAGISNQNIGGKAYLTLAGGGGFAAAVWLFQVGNEGNGNCAARFGNAVTKKFAVFDTWGTTP
ncbi:MAG: hypothetical protein HYV07_19970 [Deltaproteobacteria bacterium]|nr:hypothetical protein [Deltaproteobacteria bacterium]